MALLPVGLRGPWGLKMLYSSQRLSSVLVGGLREGPGDWNFYFLIATAADGARRGLRGPLFGD